MKMILKKVRVLSIVLFSIVLAVSVLGCPSEPAEPTTRQEQINAASAGSTVTLNTSFTDTTIRINKALTVDGNNIRNLNVIVDSSVRNNVTLRNFLNANITVDNSSRRALENRMARTAEANAGDDLKKLGDDVVPLFLENCTIEKIDAEADFALYLEPGEDKTVIDELNLKGGLENFTFVEVDGTGTEIDDKSKVGKLNIEDGIEEINLIGGTFDDVDFADDFTGSVEFKYDKEFVDDQLKFDNVDDFFADAKVEEKDVAIADNNEASLSGVWKIELAKDDLDYFNGYVSIVFLKDSQIANFATEDGSWANWDPFTKDSPIYCLTSAGDFKYDSSNNSELKTLYGSEDCIWTPSGFNEYGDMLFEQINFTMYPNYAKESVIVKETNDKITYYVNLDNIKKTDLLIGANSEGTAIGAPGQKVSAVDLAGYKPYFALDWNRFAFYWNFTEDVAADRELSVDAHSLDTYESFANGIRISGTGTENDGQFVPTRGGGTCYNHITSSALNPDNAISINNRTVYIPVSESIQLVNGMPEFFFFPMTDASSEGYPDVSGVQYSNITVPRE